MRSRRMLDMNLWGEGGVSITFAIDSGINVLLRL